MVDPRLMCRQHLLGEHSELHKFLPSWSKRQRIDGRVAGNAIEPSSYAKRHDELAREMSKRGYKHKSPCPQPDFSYLPPEQQSATVDRAASMALLLSRCQECKKRSGVDMAASNTPSPQETAEVVSEVCDSFWSFATTVMFWEFLSKYKDPVAQLESLIKLWGKTYEQRMREFASQEGGEVHEGRLKLICGLAEDEIRQKAVSGLAWIKSHRGSEG